MPATRAMLARAKEWKPKFLADYGQHGCVTFAAKAAHVDVTTVYRALKTDGTFRDAVAELDATSVKDVLVHEAYRRGIVGWDEPVYQGGKKVGTVRKFSDSLLVKLLEARVSEQFGRKMALTGEGGGPIATTTTVTVVSNAPRPAAPESTATA